MMNCSRDNAVRDNLRYSTHELGDDGWDTNADSLLFVPGGVSFHLVKLFPMNIY